MLLAFEPPARMRVITAYRPDGLWRISKADSHLTTDDVAAGVLCITLID